MTDRAMSSSEDRESRLATTFVELTGSIVGEFDVIDLLTGLASRAVELLDAEAAGVLLADTQGHLRVMAASDERTELLELFQLQNDEGPCLDCFASGHVVEAADLRGETPWPTFAAESLRVGFGAVCAVPLRVREQIIGAFNLFLGESRQLSRADIAMAQALGDVASIAIVQDHAARLQLLHVAQLQGALDSRVLIEQAKGMIAEHRSIDMDAAFALLRTYARNHNHRLTDVAVQLVDHELRPADLS